MIRTLKHWVENNVRGKLTWDKLPTTYSASRLRPRKYEGSNSCGGFKGEIVNSIILELEENEDDNKYLQN